MAATVSPGFRSVILNVTRPYEEDGVTPRDDLIGMKVWVSTTSGFQPVDEFGSQVATPVFDGTSLHCSIQDLLPGTTHYLRYALISEIDPSACELSPEMSCTPSSVAVSGVLTNDSALIKTDSSGLGGVFDSTSGIFKVYDGLSDITGSQSVTYSIVQGAVTPGLSVNIQPSGEYAITGMDVDSATATFVATYQGVSVEKIFSVAKVKSGVDANLYRTVVESSRGNVFRVGQSSRTILSARVFKNDSEVTDQISESWFRWRRVSLDSAADELWNAAYQAGYRRVEVNVDDVNSKASFFCDIVSP